MIHLPILSLLIWLPVVTAVGCLLLRRHAQLAWVFATGVSVISVMMCARLYFAFDGSTAAYQFTEKLNWIPSYGIHYALGVDGISMLLVILTCVTTLLVVLASREMVSEHLAEYLAIFLLMQATVVGVFCALDAILFYSFWEAMLIPMVLSIGIWGGKNRGYAAIKFFIYTFLGSALMLIALLYLHQRTGSFSILHWMGVPLSAHVQHWLFWAFLLAFAIKIPMWPVHTWLPDAHTEAPTGGSVVLAALMLKVGGYGFFRFCLPMLPAASFYYSPLMIGLSLVAIVYIGTVALAQTDMKKLIAYSSIAHMGFVTLGTFMVFVVLQRTANTADAFLSLEGSMVQMISHAFGSGAMFLGFGLLYHQLNTRSINHFGGIAKVMPIFAAFFMLFAMSNVGLPGTSGFVGEFMILLSTFKASFWVTLLAASTLVIGAAYTLWMYKRVFYGPITQPPINQLQDISGMSVFIFILIAVCIIGLGVFPNVMLQPMHGAIAHLLSQVGRPVLPTAFA